MNKVLFEQLKSCKVARIGNISQDSNHIIINKAQKQNAITSFNTPINTISVGKTCVIKLERYITNPPPNFTLASDWNGGTNPPSEYMLVTFTKVLAKMVQFSGYSYDYIQGKTLDKQWSGWVPIKSMSIITETN